MSYSIVLADENKTYRDRLSGNLESDKFEITVAENSEALADTLKDVQCDVLLMSPSMYNDTVNLENARLVILLTDGQTDTLPSELSGFGKINKYLRISDISGAVIKGLAELPVVDAQWRVVLSASGGAGTTVVALAMAIKLAKTGKRVLYLNMETYNSTSAFFGCEGEGMAQLTGASKLLFKKDEKSCVLYFPFTDSIWDGQCETTYGVTKFCEAINEAGHFDIVVADMFNVWDKRMKTILDLAGDITIVADLSEPGSDKLKALLNRESFGMYKPKTRLIYNKKERDWSTPDYGLPIAGEIIAHRHITIRDLAETVGTTIAV